MNVKVLSSRLPVSHLARNFDEKQEEKMNIQFKQFKQLKKFLQDNTNQFNSIFPNSVICVSNGHIHLTPDGKFGTFADFAVRKAHYGAHFSVLYRTARGLQEPKFFYATRNTTFNGTIRINKNALELWRHYGYPMNILAFGCNNCYYIMDKEELRQRAEEAIKTEDSNDKYYFLSTKNEWKPLKTEFTKEDYAFGEKINFRYLQNYVFSRHSNGHSVTCKFPDGREMQAKSRTSLYKWLKSNTSDICPERTFTRQIKANKPIKCTYKGQQIALIITDNTTTRSKLFNNEKSAPKLNVVAMEDKFNNGLELTTLDNLAGTKKQFFIINKLIAARLAADVCGVPTIVVARTDADAADLLTSDIDERDQKFVTGNRTTEGFFEVKNGVEQGIDRGLSYAPYADLIWMETSNPDLDYARKFAEGIHAKFPGKMLAYNCSPSFNWAAKLSVPEMETFREELAKMGYKFQFITLAGFHALNTSMFELALAYKKRGMAGYSELQEREFALQKEGFRAVKHQSFVGTGYFDALQTVITAGNSSVVAMKDSTESAQFH